MQRHARVLSQIRKKRSKHTGKSKELGKHKISTNVAEFFL